MPKRVHEERGNERNRAEELYQITAKRKFTETLRHRPAVHVAGANVRLNRLAHAVRDGMVVFEAGRAGVYAGHGGADLQEETFNG